MFAALIESGASSLLGAKNASGDNVYHIIARSKNMQLLLLVAEATKVPIHVIAGNALGRSPLMLALEGGGGIDGAAVAVELINISGAFASGMTQTAQLFSRNTISSSSLMCCFCFSLREIARKKQQDVSAFCILSSYVFYQ